MRAVILVGGKGKRLMPLTQNIRKAYLPLGNKRVVDHIIDRLPKGISFSISENDSGAMAAISEALTGEEPVMVICGDNYFGESLDGFVQTFTRNTLIGIYDIEDKEKAKKYGVVETYPSGRIRRFYEKPEKPNSTLVSTGIYIFPPVLYQGIKQFARLSPDINLGDLINQLNQYHPVHSYLFEGVWFDIGSHESYQEALKVVE
ncbi:unnamed protein product [marine sediment metagenome]|uniref:Nucleotidyl transferase domain-containing protein n=1 Tax=marine sediment metagenome TaxID=412755 RepID=X1M4G3_9ZZZZ